MSQVNKSDYTFLVQQIGSILNEGRKQAAKQVNNILVETYWNIGKYIVEYEQKGEDKAEYGSELLATLSRDLKVKYGKGFSRRNILDMRRFFIVYPIWQTLSAKLSWSHYTKLLSVSDDLARSFYEKQAIGNDWSVVR